MRYFPKEFHKILAEEFYTELKTHGHIYMYRFRPRTYEIKAYPIEYYPTKSKQAAAILLMLFNNVSYEIA